MVEPLLPESDSWLPDDIERRVLDILQLPETEVEAALLALYRENPEHEQRIRERLEHADEIHARLDMALDSVSKSEESLPERIGQYRILDLLGEGGMGSVYLAEQREPVQRRVALKVIKLGMDTKQVLARFEAERQALARMDHAGIARVLDAGKTEEGRPFFAMEHVRGMPITDYCDKHRLDLRARLELFQRVCSAVQHAHQKGIIHRDLKPSNILVAEESGQNLAKIIDFGLAKAIDHSLANQTLYTRHGAVVGTPQYMSPEQADRSGLDIDTRTDVYSLGIVLFELLAGALPFDGSGQSKIESADPRLRPLAEDPPKPSTRVTSASSSNPSDAAITRRTDIAGLIRNLRGDLDWITLMAIAHDRSERYQSVSELEADVGRYLRHEPVLASPPSLRYLLAKFLRRYRIQVGAAASVIAALFVGFAVSLSLYFEATEANAAAQSKAAEANEVSSFLVGLFEAATPYRAQGADLPVSLLVEESRKRIDRELLDQPAARAQLQCTLGYVYRLLGSNDEAQHLLDAGLEWKREHLGRDDPDTLSWDLEFARLEVAQGEYQKAESSFREALERLEGLPKRHDHLIGGAMMGLGNTIRLQGRLEEAGIQLVEAVDILEDAKQANPRWMAEALILLAGNLHDRGKQEAALERYEALRSWLKDHDPGPSPQWVNLLSGLSRCYTALRQYEPALDSGKRSLEMATGLYGMDHDRVASAHVSYAHCLKQAGRWAEAEPHLRRALAIRELKNNNPIIAWISNDLGLLIGNLGQFEESVQHLERAMRIYRKLYEGDHLFVAISKHNLAEALARVGRLDEAVELAHENLAMRKRLEPEPAANVARGYSMLGLVLLYAGQLEEAEENARKSRELWDRVLPEGRTEPDIDRLLALILVTQGRGADAEVFARRALESYRSFRDDQPLVAVMLQRLGWARMLQDDPEGAKPLLSEALERLDRHYPDGHPYTAFALHLLAGILLTEQPDRALAYLRRALEIRMRFLDPSNRWRIASQLDLGRALTARGEFEEAEPYLLAAQNEFDSDRSDAGITPDPAAELVKLYEGWKKPEEAAKYRALMRGDSGR